jgi:NADH-quinone oxidoreductase subunit M
VRDYTSRWLPRGLPGLGDFIGEFLVLLGTYRDHSVVAIIGSIGVLTATFYALRLVQRAFHGPNTHAWTISDLLPREGVVIALMAGSLLWLGLNPQPVLRTFSPALHVLEAVVQMHR